MTIRRKVKKMDERLNKVVKVINSVQSIPFYVNGFGIGAAIAGSGGTTWGGITGSIKNQEDLYTVLQELEKYCDNLDSTKAAQSDLEEEAQTRSANDLELSTNLSKEVEARASADSSLQQEIQELAEKIPSISKYCNDATVTDNTLTLTFSDSSSISFTPTGQEGGITDVQVTDTTGTASVVTAGVASIDLTGYATNEDMNSKTQKLVETTYTELKSLRDSASLVPGCWYRITDYVATTTQDNTQATTNQYDIIVLATSTNILSEEARAIQHTGDTYFANSNLNTWKVWYCLDNDTDRFTWADATNGKGVVYHLIDEFDNDVWYDFKCIQVKNTNLTDRFYYLFDNEGVDASMSSSTSFPDVNGNKLGFYVNSNKFQIGCNVFKGSSFRNNTIGNYFYNNTIGNYFYNNTIGNVFYSNTIGNSFNFNTIGNNFNYNTIGNDFNFNTIGNFFHDNTIGNSFNFNTIGNNFSYNTIGNSFHDNTIGNYLCSNTIGNSFFINTIGNYFRNNNTTSQTTQPQYCSFPDGVESKITTSTTLTRLSKTTFYLGSDGTLKTLD